MIFQYTFIPKPCHPSRHAKPSSSSSPTQSQPPRLTHVIVVIKIQKLRHPSIMRQILSPIHIQFKCSPLSWHPCLKRQPHIHSAHIAQPSHLMSHSPSTQPQSFIYKRPQFEPCHSHHAVRPYAQPHVNTRIHSPSRQQGKTFHTHTSCHQSPLCHIRLHHLFLIPVRMGLAHRSIRAIILHFTNHVVLIVHVASHSKAKAQHHTTNQPSHDIPNLLQHTNILSLSLVIQNNRFLKNIPSVHHS